VHDPRLTGVEALTIFGLKCKLLQQITFLPWTYSRSSPRKPDLPCGEWAFCHTRPVKSRMFVDDPKVAGFSSICD
jgi:hypothetical protein